MRETTTYERKEDVSKSFLKTVSAYANYGTGSIVFGVRDDGSVAGLADPVDACMRIENMINDSLDPVPRYVLEPDMEDKTVTLTVFEGPDKPYLSGGKAYRRSDSATIAVDRLEHGRLVLEGSNRTYDALPSRKQDLTFSILDGRLEEKLGIATVDDNVMKTLELLSLDGSYTNAAALLADENDFKGIDAVRFGATINEFMDRRMFVGISAIAQLEGVLAMFRTYYRYEKIEGAERVSVELVPEEAFREAIANAIVHRAWDVAANISVSMFSDRVEIASPGALPKGLTAEEYLGGHISVLRNPILANVFFRLRYIEKFGTGVLRINAAYAGLGRTPMFNVRPESIVVTLPVLGDALLSSDERAVLAAIPPYAGLSRAEISSAVGFGKDKTVRILNTLLSKGAVEKTGEGRAVRYHRA